MKMELFVMIARARRRWQRWWQCQNYCATAATAITTHARQLGIQHHRQLCFFSLLKMGKRLKWSTRSTHHLTWSSQWCNSNDRIQSIAVVNVLVVVVIVRLELYISHVCHKLFSALVFVPLQFFETLCHSQSQFYAHTNTNKQTKYIKFNDENAFWFLPI